MSRRSVRLTAIFEQSSKKMATNDTLIDIREGIIEVNDNLERIVRYLDSNPHRVSPCLAKQIEEIKSTLKAISLVVSGIDSPGLCTTYPIWYEPPERNYPLVFTGCRTEEPCSGG